MQNSLSDDPDWQSAIDLAAVLGRRETSAAETFEADVAALQARGVIFEEYDLPDLKTVNGVATIGEIKGAWFKDSEGNLLTLSQFTA